MNTTTAEDFFLMSNLFPKRTGLPFVVWISVKGGARHDIRIKVARGTKVNPNELITVALRPEVRELNSHELLPAEMELLQKWVDLNWGVLIEYWNSDIDTVEAIERLKPLAQ
jgi:hypothetical protein